MSRWPPIEFPHVYTYLIDTPGEFTREKLKAFKSLQAYNYKVKSILKICYVFTTSISVVGFKQSIIVTLVMKI